MHTKIDKDIPFLYYKDSRTAGDKKGLSYKAGLILLDDREIETVLMGMGEPLLNYINARDAINIILKDFFHYSGCICYYSFLYPT
ncbi:MAG: hypothetical protein P9L98_02515 [Candidatus Kaelpia imicola]|nr:hypothetical protein [Candidatus Kaelpia imicola]